METAVEIAGNLDQTSSQQRQNNSGEKRRKMKRSGIDIQHIEYTETCKTIRHRMKEEIRSYDEEQQLKALENSKGLKSTKRKQCLGRNNILGKTKVMLNDHMTKSPVIVLTVRLLKRLTVMFTSARQ